ncbi:APC family permease [Rhodococcus sp. NCIMB 12038]|uniref:APC family permease n=1 Tax=Rhodococcus sp. NCIMB 12038 TaxID=933800 RepID=UPI001C4E515D|nr:APC family permease [Rhodococcus sp. NCIMB 12038]
MAQQQGEPANRLSGNMGVGELVMSVLAFSAPLTTVAGFIPVLLTFSGRTAPAIYLVVTVLLVLFSVGFTTMGRRVQNPGGFYSFVTAGLGRPAGLGGALLATFGYTAIGFFAPAFFAVTVQSYVVDLGGPEIAWYWYALALIAVTTALAYRRIDLSARVLTFVMLLEVITVIVFDVAAFVHGGPADGGGAGFSLPSITDASIGLAVLFVVGNFLGFEATVIYRDEVKNPNKTIPLATYIAVGSIGIFYAIAAWAYLAFFGADRARDAAVEDTAGMFSSALLNLTGKIVVDVVTILLMTSILASVLSIHNVAARYLFSLGTDRVLPSVLGKVHPHHRSPFVSASLIGGVWAVLVIFFAAIGVGAEKLYPIASGTGTFAILLLMLGTSIAVVVYLRKNRGDGDSFWRTTVAPVVAALGLAGVAVLAVINYSELIGGTGLIAILFLAFTFGLPIAGVVLANILRTRKPDAYERIGRQQI